MSPQNEPEVDATGVSDVGTSVPRRQFLKRSGAATAGTILAWHGTRVDVYAEDSGGWHDESEVSPYPAPFTKGEVAAEAIANLPTVLGETPPTLAELLDFLDWEAEDTFEITLRQRVTWQEYRDTPTGDPTKYRRVSWSYDGNHLSNWERLVNGTQVKPTPYSVGYVIAHEGFTAGDHFTVDWLEGGSDVIDGTNSQPAPFDEGVETDIAGTEYFVRRGVMDQHDVVQPQAIVAKSDDEVSSFEFDHTIPAVFIRAYIPVRVDISGPPPMQKLYHISIIVVSDDGWTFYVNRT